MREPYRAHVCTRKIVGSSTIMSTEQKTENYLPLVQREATEIHRRLPPEVDLESLTQSGVLGLLEAARRFNPTPGVPFQTYARYRIRGEIIEYLRSLDWVSRSVRAWGRRVATARSRLGRNASPAEMAAELGVSLKEYYRVDQKVSAATMDSLEDLSVASEGEWEKAQEESSRPSFQDPFISVEGKELVEKLGAAIAKLPERERLVVTLYYHEELTLREVGEVLGTTESYACQIHGRAVQRLRQALGATKSQGG